MVLMCRVGHELVSEHVLLVQIQVHVLITGYICILTYMYVYLLLLGTLHA